VALVVQTGTEAHLRQAHDVLNGVFRRAARRAGAAPHARLLLRARTVRAGRLRAGRQSPDVPRCISPTCAATTSASRPRREGVRVLVRARAAPAAFDAMQPGDRSRPAEAGRGASSRAAALVRGAVMAKDRVFSPVQVAPRGASWW
jgi:hypothetical protein